MDWTIDFSQLIQATYWLAAAVAVLSLLMIAIVTVMRQVTARRERALRRFEARWTPLLRERSHLEKLPAVDRSEAEWFLIMWNDAQESAAGDGEGRPDRETLNEIARRTRMDELALRWLGSRDITRALSAIIAVGYLGDGRAVQALQELAGSADPILSFAASRALVQIHSIWAPQFVDRMTERRDWSRFKLLASIEELSGVVEQPILEKIAGAPVEEQRELMQYLRFFGPAHALPVLRRVLQATTDEMTISSALRVLEAIGEPSDCALASSFASHPDWRVRVQVANVLRARGGSADLATLQLLLHDPQWWVRYRAAQAVTGIAGAGDRLDEIIRREHDRYAVDIIEQVLKENSTYRQESATP